MKHLLLSGLLVMTVSAQAQVPPPPATPVPAVPAPLLLPAPASRPDTLVLIGQLPGRYFAGTDAHTYVLGFVEMKNRVIQKVGKLQASEVEAFIAQNTAKQVLRLRRAGQNSYDVIYPGLINLHNHTKQNNIPVWGEAQGQFANRFEWRDFPNYKYSVSGNINPWVDYARAVECATYRWSELSALVLGTTYLQGPSSCVGNFGIMRVEEADSYVSDKASLQAPTDLVIPEDMEIVWSTLGPLIRAGKTYEAALAETIKKYCPTVPVTAENVNSSEMLKTLKDPDKLKELCTVEGQPNRFIRYVYWVHPTIAGRKNYLNGAGSHPPAAVIAHLAEGRRDDEYNKKEYEIVKLLGLDRAHVNFVHGVGIPKETLPELAQKGIGLIWSPFSNLILYSQTLDVGAALKAGVTVAIGSDWLPTGTKSVLEEVKIARRYILKDVDGEGLVAAFSGGTGKAEKIDEVLFKMMTENPARMINHSEIKKGPVTRTNPSGYAETAVGTIAPGAMASLMVASYQDANPYTNLVKLTTEKDVNLVVVDGEPVYGNRSYLDTLGYQGRYELLPADSAEHSTVEMRHQMSPPADPTPESKLQYVVNVIKSFAGQRFEPEDKCGFSEPKAMVTPHSLDDEEDLRAFRDASGIDLDRVQDITRVLAINLMTQSRNKLDPKEGKPEFALKYFPALYSCNDENHMRRLENFIKPEGNDDFAANRRYRAQVIERDRLGRIPQQLAEKYK